MMHDNVKQLVLTMLVGVATHVDASRNPPPYRVVVDSGASGTHASVSYGDGPRPSLLVSLIVLGVLALVGIGIGIWKGCQPGGCCAPKGDEPWNTPAARDAQFNQFQSVGEGNYGSRNDTRGGGGYDSRLYGQRY